MRRADQGAGGAWVGGGIRPAVQRADDVAAGLGVESAAILEDQRLTVAAHVGNQFDAFGRMNERAALLLLGQGVEVARFGHREAVSDVARSGGEKRLQLAGIERFVEVRGNRELARSLLQLKT